MAANRAYHRRGGLDVADLLPYLHELVADYQGEIADLKARLGTSQPPVNSKVDQQPESD